MKILLSLLAAVLLIVVLASCSLLGGSTTPVVTGSSGYPDSVVYKMKLSSETYLCSNFTVSKTDQEISLLLTDVYSMASDGKIIWIGKEKTISAVTIEKITK
jgi:hypothetical protein